MNPRALAARLRAGGYSDAARNLPRVVAGYGLPVTRPGHPRVTIAERSGELVALVGDLVVADEHACHIKRAASVPDDIDEGPRTMRTMRIPDTLWDAMRRAPETSTTAAFIAAAKEYLQRRSL